MSQQVSERGRAGLSRLNGGSMQFEEGLMPLAERSMPAGEAPAAADEAGRAEKAERTAMAKATVEVTVLNEEGLHARPAMRFVDAANAFGADIVVRSESDTVDGKSVMGMITLGATQGTRLTIEASGDDAPAAVESLKRLFDEKFGED